MRMEKVRCDMRTAHTLSHTCTRCLYATQRIRVREMCVRHGDSPSCSPSNQSMNKNQHCISSWGLTRQTKLVRTSCTSFNALCQLQRCCWDVLKIRQPAQLSDLTRTSANPQPDTSFISSSTHTHLHLSLVRWLRQSSDHDHTYQPKIGAPASSSR